MFLIQMLLPLGEDDSARVRTTRTELANRFGGVTAYLQTPASGEWTRPDGARERDQVIMVEIVVPAFDRDWWRAYAKTLSERFEQDAIHIRALQVELVDPDSA